MKKYNIIIPSIQNSLNIGKELIELKKSSPEFFNENIEKIHFGGIFNYCIWSSQFQDRQIYTYENVENIIKFCREFDVSVFYDFANTKLKKESVYDSYSNMLLSVSKEIKTYAIVYSSYLAEYLSENYPQITLIKPEFSDETTKNENYKLNIINYNTYKQNPEEIRQNPEKYILYLNSYGDINRELFDRNCQEILEFASAPVEYLNESVAFFEDSKKLSSFISQENMTELSEVGIENFIIRNHQKNIYELIDSYVYYLVKPEFQDKIRLKLIKQLMLKR